MYVCMYVCMLRLFELLEPLELLEDLGRVCMYYVCVCMYVEVFEAFGALGAA